MLNNARGPIPEGVAVAQVDLDFLRQSAALVARLSKARAMRGIGEATEQEKELLAKRREIVFKYLANEPGALESSLKLFIQAAWPQVEARPYVDGFHIDAICDHLEAVSRGEIKQLIINIPPRHSKSLVASVLWPAWEWTTQPYQQYLCFTYAHNLTVRDALKMRRLVASEWYKGFWGDKVQLRHDQWAKTRFENTAGGHRHSSSVGGITTGAGGTRIIIDDPHNVMDTESPNRRQEVLNWHDDALATRDNDANNFARVVIMQRIHQNDLAGHLLEQGGWELLKLPMEYEGDKSTTCIGWQDPRNEPGQILCPARFNREAVERIKRSLGPRGAAGQLQQRPAAKGGNEFSRAWWDGVNRWNPGEKRWGTRVVARWLSFDTAMKDGQHNDYSAMACLELMDDYRLKVAHIWQDKIKAPVLVHKIETEIARWDRDGKLQGVLIEDKASGTGAIQTLGATLPPEAAQLLIPYQPQGSKEYRARLASIWCERDCVLLPLPGVGGAAWLFDFEEQLFQFPNAKHDDMVDALVQGILYLERYLEIGWSGRNGLYEEPELI